MKKMSETKKVSIPTKLYVAIETHSTATGKTVDQEATDILKLGIAFLDLHVAAEKILKEKEAEKHD
jgi:hypothetical protein